MPTPIELTLSSLLPTVSPLPLELIDLSTSLLAQSRSKAAALKPEEEIARTYACCHIACQRLGHRFGLEIAPPAPPVKPRVYQKLHAYFNSVLATPKPGRKKAPVQEAHGNDSNSAGRVQNTPVSRKRPADEKPATPASARKRSRRDEKEVPHYVMPMIRHLCRIFDVPEIAPHAYAGVQSLLLPSNAAPLDTNSLQVDDIAPQVIRVFDTVYHKMYPAKTTKEQKEQHTQMQKALEEYCQENTESLPFQREDSGVVLLPTLGPLPAECNHPVSWEGMEWFQNIPTTTDPENSEDEIRAPTRQPYKTPLRREKRASKRDPDADDEPGAAGLLPGLGTMFQPAIDWLSDERKAHYEQWRKTITRRMEQKV